VRNYFSADVIPVLEHQRGNYNNLVATSKIDFLGPLVMIVGLIVIAYGLLMVALAAEWAPWARPQETQAAGTATGGAGRPLPSS
jgi:hypothetical protein